MNQSLHNTRIDADPTDGRSWVVDDPDNPMHANDAITALIRSKRWAEKRGKEWTAADAYRHTKRFVKRRYR